MKRDPALFRLLPVTALLLVTSALLPAGAAASPLEPSPASLAFSQEVVGTTGPAQGVLVSDPLPGPARIDGVSISGEDPGDFVITADGCAGTLEESQACLVEVAFAPQAGGARGAVLEIEVEGEAAIQVPLGGSGLTRWLTLPASLTFPLTSVGLAATEQIVLSNESEAGVNVDQVKFEGTDAGDFGIEGNDCLGFIAPGQSCRLEVRFSPDATGAREARLEVISGGTPGESTTTLSGEGAAPELAFEPAAYDFGLLEAHSGGTRTTLALRNVGAAPVQLSNLEIAGPDTDEFWISGSDCWGATLAPGAGCSVEVQFDADEEGSSSAAVRVSAGPASFEAPLSGRAERPKVEASPAPLDFGPVAVGASETRQVTLTDVGHLPVGFFIAIISGGDVSAFHMVEEDCTSDLFAGHPHIFEPGESCTAKIRFEPTGAGAETATASFFGNGEGALQVAVGGTGVPAQVSLSPPSRDFGPVAVGGAGSVQSFELRDESADPYTVDSAILAGPDLGDFAIRSDGCSETTLEPGGSCAVTVRFAPASAGAETATLRLRGPGGVSVARLQGEGVAPTPTVAGRSRRGGRVVVRFRRRADGADGGGLEVGHARCASEEGCTVSISGHLGGAWIAAREVRLAAGASAPIAMATPASSPTSRGPVSLGVVLRWQTGARRGTASRVFRLG